MLKTLVINSNQIVLSFGVLIAFLSPKQSKNEGKLCIVMAKQMEDHLHEESKLWSFIVLCQSQSRMRGKTEKGI